VGVGETWSVVVGPGDVGVGVLRTGLVDVGKFVGVGVNAAVDPGVTVGAAVGLCTTTGVDRLGWLSV
jgi:hypothetical protein